MHHPARTRTAIARKRKPAENRFDTFPAGSTRRKKNGTPRASTRCNVESRWHACSNDTPKRAAIDGDIETESVTAGQSVAEILRKLMGPAVGALAGKIT